MEPRIQYAQTADGVSIARKGRSSASTEPTWPTS